MEGTNINAHIEAVRAANKSQNKFDTQVSEYLKFLDNEYVIAAVSLFLILYAAVIAPRLPMWMLRFLDNWLVQLVLFFAIVYISNRNATIALIAAVAVLVTIMVANNQIMLRLAIGDARSRAEQFHGGDEFYNMPLADINLGKDRPDRLDGDDVDDDDDYLQPRACPRMLANMREANMREGNMMKNMMKQEMVNDVEGILPEHIEVNDVEHAKSMNNVAGGAITSKNGPMMPDRSESESESQSETDSASDMDSIRRALESGREYVSGVVANMLEDATAGTSLDETKTMGSEQAPANHVDSINAKRKNSAEEALRDHVEEVTKEVEQVQTKPVPENVQQEVLEEVKNKVVEMAKEGKKITKYDVIRTCREIYRERL